MLPRVYNDRWRFAFLECLANSVRVSFVNQIFPLNRTGFPKTALRYTYQCHNPILVSPSHLRNHDAAVDNLLHHCYFGCYGEASTTACFSHYSSIALFCATDNLCYVALTVLVLLH